MAKDCKERVRPTVCHMCGTEGHISDNCKNAKCLRCGLPNVYYSHTGCMHCRRLSKSNCYVCGAKGHARSTCPDMWRRFHATLSGPEGVVSKPFGGLDRSHKPSSQIWCCNCAKKGHYLHHCSAYSYSAYPRPVLHVINYNNLICQSESDSSPLMCSTPSISKSQKRKKEMREVKLRKQAFRSLNNTPNTYRSYENGTNSMPVTPPLDGIEKELINVPDSLEKAKQTLEELLSMEGSCETSSKKWRKQKKNKEKEVKSKDNISINYSGKGKNKRTTCMADEWRDDDIFAHCKSKRPKKSLSKLQERSKLCNDVMTGDRSKNGSRHQEDDNGNSTQYKKNNKKASYGTASRPPNMMNRLSKLAKIKRTPKKISDHYDTIHNGDSKRNDKKLFKLINKTIGESKKSSHFALNQIVKNMRKKYKK